MFLFLYINDVFNISKCKIYFQTYAMRDITIKTKKNSNSSLFSILKNKNQTTTEMQESLFQVTVADTLLTRIIIQFNLW